MEGSCRLSVVIAAYNAADTIGEQLEALARQRWSEPWEVIVINNRSSDHTVQVVRGFSGAIHDLRIIEAREKQGQPHAANVGAHAARSEAVAFCDADDVVAEGWVAAMGEGLKRHVFVAGPLETERLNIAPLARHRPRLQQTGVQEFRYPPFLPHAASCNMGIRRRLFEAAGGFDESLAALFDTDLCWRLQLRGIPLTPLPDAVVHYRRRDRLGALLRQAKTYAEYDVALYKRYRPLGMPQLSKKSGIAAWVDLVRGVGSLRYEERRANYLWNLGWRTGRLYGSIKHRVWAL